MDWFRGGDPPLHKVLGDGFKVLVRLVPLRLEGSLGAGGGAK